MTNIQEQKLVIIKDGVAITNGCQFELGCDTVANTFTFSVESLSEFALARPLDSDNDGIPNDFAGEMDECPYSDETATVVIDSCNSGVENILFEDGCKISDDVTMCINNASTHGQFVRCVDSLLLLLKKKKNAIITNQEAEAIKSCAVHSDLP
jgi:hypothetical protein